MIAEVCPDMPVIFVDTGYHFPETLVFRDELQLKLKLNIKTVNPHPKASKSLRGAMESLYEADPDLCCRVHKVEPVIQALHEMGAKAWVMGIRRGQTVERSGIPFFESRSDGIVRVHPVANWNSHDIQTYIDRYNLPVHPLLEKGYTSISCAPCTRPIYEGEDERAGRWSGTAKTECGLYTKDSAQSAEPY
jgi:phosphoadenosine phosphosulfate reductase